MSPDTQPYKIRWAQMYRGPTLPLDHWHSEGQNWHPTAQRTTFNYLSLPGHPELPSPTHLSPLLPPPPTHTSSPVHMAHHPLDLTYTFWVWVFIPNVALAWKHLPPSLPAVPQNEIQPTLSGSSQGNLVTPRSNLSWALTAYLHHISSPSPPPSPSRAGPVMYRLHACQGPGLGLAPSGSH